MTTIGTHDVSLSYTVTPNTDDRVESMDYQSVPFLGIEVKVFEGESFAVDVYGRYDSPFQIVAMEPSPDSTGGFITPSVPEPGGFAMIVSGLAGLACLRTRVAAINLQS